MSRARVYVLRALAEDDLAVDRSALASRSAGTSTAAPELLVRLADGDARRCLNLLESGTAQLADEVIDEALVSEAAGSRYRRFDKGGDAFYDQISALHKAVRGSAPDAALYWLCRMLDGGCDPLYVAVGWCAWRAKTSATQILAVCSWPWRPGTPMNGSAPRKGELALAQAVLYLASVPKSNAAYKAFGAATEHVKTDRLPPGAHASAQCADPAHEGNGAR